MRFLPVLLAALFFATPAFAATQITCSQIPEAQRFLETLKPGPNTREAQIHLDAAKRAKTNRECVHELGIVNYYATRSAEADRRDARRALEETRAREETRVRHEARVASEPARPLPPHVKCADIFHQDRPGGSDYKGPPVPGCKRVP